MALSTEILAKTYSLAGGALTLVGTGGVFDAADAYAKIRAGATLVQLYSAMVYRGPSVAAAIAADLGELLRRDGFARVADAVGVDRR
jgi:dihydroorotate dehydrogenase